MIFKLMKSNITKNVILPYYALDITIKMFLNKLQKNSALKYIVFIFRKNIIPKYLDNKLAIRFVK